MRDYATILKRLRQYSENCVAYKLDADFANAVTDAADAIEELIDKVPTWISAKKPPEKPDFYWCNIENTVFPGRYYQEKLWYDSEYFVNVDGIVILHVTHYMPLPEPPKENTHD